MDDLIDSALLRQKRQRYKGMWATGTVIGQTIEGSIMEVSQTSNKTLPSNTRAILPYHMAQLM